MQYHILLFKYVRLQDKTVQILNKNEIIHCPTKLFRHLWVVVAAKTFYFFLRGSFGHLEDQRRFSKSQIFRRNETVKENVNS